MRSPQTFCGTPREFFSVSKPGFPTVKGALQKTRPPPTQSYQESGNPSRATLKQEDKMARVERRDKEPQPADKKEPGGSISRRDFLIGSGTGIAGLVIGGVVGRSIAPTAAPVSEDPAALPVAQAPAAAGETAPAAVEYKAGHMLFFDPLQCTGCMMCATACAEHWSALYYPEQTKNTVNLEFSRIRPTRFQYVDVVSVCQDCKLFPWAEGSDRSPCEEVCPEEAILHIPEGEGKPGYYGMGYKWIDRDKCLGADKCWRCAEICEDQFGMGISFDPIEKKAAACSRCGGDPQCVKVCPEPLALRFMPVGRNGRFHSFKPAEYGELVYRKAFNTIRSL
jgi:anaerobic carbon-monoxide dehydrogenase iron sulfur subunit